MRAVFITAGHDTNSVGASGGGMRETDINLDQALACYNELKKYRCRVGISRTAYGEANDEVNAEVAKTNAFKPDVAISFHNNAGGGDGAEILVYPNTATSAEIGYRILAKYKALGQNSRGVKTRTNLGFLTYTHAPALIVETAFMDNPVDRGFIDTLAERQAQGRAVAEAVAEYWKIERIAPVKMLDEIFKTGASVKIIDSQNKELGWTGRNETVSGEIQGNFLSTAKGYIRLNELFPVHPWLNEGGKKHLKRADGTVAKGLTFVENRTFALDKTTGEVLTGAVNIDGKKVFAGADGALLSGQFAADSKDWYYIMSNGLRATGKVYIGADMHMFDSEGRAVSGKKTIEVVLDKKGKVGWR